jgi:leader peptidase (prepilin peptidase)/N-methyltransferase
VLARTLADSLTGAVVGAGGLLAIALSYKLVRKIEGMGLGDVKMMAMLGAALGWQPLLPLLVIASFTGALVGLFVAMKSGKGMQIALPFGVFLGLAFLVVLFFGNELFDFWAGLLVVPE